MSVCSKLALSLALVTLVGCSDNSGPESDRFLEGTLHDPGIALMLSATRNSLLMLQTGAPDTRSEIPLGSSSAVTPVDFVVRGRRAMIPLGNAASVAIADLTTGRIERFFVFPSGNVSGGTWITDETGIACSTSDNYCGRFSLSQAGNAVTDTVHVTDMPNTAVTVGSRIFVVSSNLDEDNFYQPIGDGVVTELDPTTLHIVRTFTVGENPQYAAVGPDGNLYVPNTGDYVHDGSLSVINLTTNTVETFPSFGAGPGDISIDAQGRAFISSYGIGTVVWNTATHTFIRGPENPVCAPITGGSCRGASGAEVAPNGDLYQAFPGSSSSNQPAYLFIYDGTTLALSDSVPIPLGPSGFTTHNFR